MPIFYKIISHPAGIRTGYKATPASQAFIYLDLLKKIAQIILLKNNLWKYNKEATRLTTMIRITRP